MLVSVFTISFKLLSLDILFDISILKLSVVVESFDNLVIVLIIDVSVLFLVYSSFDNEVDKLLSLDVLVEVSDDIFVFKLESELILFDISVDKFEIVAVFTFNVDNDVNTLESIDCLSEVSFDNNEETPLIFVLINDFSSVILSFNDKSELILFDISFVKLTVEGVSFDNLSNFVMIDASTLFLITLSPDKDIVNVFTFELVDEIDDDKISFNDNSELIRCEISIDKSVDVAELIFKLLIAVLKLLSFKILCEVSPDNCNDILLSSLNLTEDSEIILSVKLESPETLSDASTLTISITSSVDPLLFVTSVTKLLSDEIL
jgi:hypothetical protein